MDDHDGHLQADLDGDTSEADLFDDADIEQAYEELRKQSSDPIHLNNCSINNKTPNGSEAAGEESFKKKTHGKPEGVSQFDRNAPFISKSTMQDTHQRKFCHFTKRRRQGNGNCFYHPMMNRYVESVNFCSSGFDPILDALNHTTGTTFTLLVSITNELHMISFRG